MKLVEPKASVILIAFDGYDAIAITMAHLRRQTIAKSLELILMHPEKYDLPLKDKTLASFFSIQVLRIESEKNTGHWRATAVRHASAPLVIFAEDHSFPAPDWAEHLIAAHNERTAVVGPTLSNANPATFSSWADFYMNFGAYAERTDPVFGSAPWHSSCYRRDLLLSYGDRLDRKLEVEGLLQNDLQQRGYEVVVIPAARSEHVNFSRVGAFLRQQFVNGRHFAAGRSADWPRVFAGINSFLCVIVPFRRLFNVVTNIQRTRKMMHLFPGITVVLALGLISNAMGEMIGYMFGRGRTSEQKFDMEFRRYRFVTECDRQALYGHWLNPAGENTASQSQQV